jgi:hypothetical protein
VGSIPTAGIDLRRFLRDPHEPELLQICSAGGAGIGVALPGVGIREELTRFDDRCERSGKHLWIRDGLGSGTCFVNHRIWAENTVEDE